MCITPIFTGFKNFSAPMYGEFIEQDGQCVLRIKKPIEQYVIKYGLLGIVLFYFLLPGLLFTDGTSLFDIWSLLFPVVWLMIAWTCMRYNEKKFFYRPLERIRGLCEQN